MEFTVVISILYLVASALFILGLKRMGSPATARTGNLLAAIAMLLAVIGVLIEREVVSYWIIALAMVLGSGIGALVARTIKMTAMPQLVGLLNGLGGGASGLVASAEFMRLWSASEQADLDVSISIVFASLIGWVTVSGSVIAFFKLQELMSGRAIRFFMQKSINLVLFLLIIGLGSYLVWGEFSLPVFYAIILLSLLLGVLLVLPIGGADMPVVISLLNSYSGLAAATAGFVLRNPVLIIGGTLVAAAGLILTQIMCKAMNRSLFNVMFGAFGAQTVSKGKASPDVGKSVRDVSAEDAAIALAYARSVIFVPGYGLAVSQAQHHVRELAELLESRNVLVKYAIHPVAGRMPGHMNVLLAEANVPYDKLYDLDQVNDEFDRTDVAVVIGANDVVNIAARDVPSSPIYGMPILNVDHAQNVLVIKRSLSPGFAGIDNDLFYKDKTMMFFSDAKEGLIKIIGEIKSI